MICHVGHACFVLSTFAVGGTVVLGRSPGAGVAAAAVAEHRVTALWAGSPAMMAAFDAAVDASGADIESLTVAVFGWGAVPPEVYDRLRKHAPNLRLMGIFGQTETIACHRFWPSRWEELYRATSPATNYVGAPSAMLASKIVDIDGTSLERQVDEPGEAVYRSPTVTAGYYRDEAATRFAFEGGWFHSGDSCRFDENGLRIMVDRFKDIVKTGGENVSSLRVEAVVVSHPAVEKVAVIGVPDERWGESVTAVVVPAEGAEIIEADIIGYARARLAGFETPKAVIVTDALPETVGGKVLKYKLRQAFA
ncbi:MAG TPA: AMP-binding protein [Aldersonia sp.]